MPSVSRFKICTYELGDGSLTGDEQARIREALQAEADRLRQISSQLAARAAEWPLGEPG